MAKTKSRIGKFHRQADGSYKHSDHDIHITRITERWLVKHGGRETAHKTLEAAKRHGYMLSKGLTWARGEKP